MHFILHILYQRNSCKFNTNSDSEMVNNAKRVEHFTEIARSIEMKKEISPWAEEYQKIIRCACKAT